MFSTKSNSNINSEKIKVDEPEDDALRQFIAHFGFAFNASHAATFWKDTNSIYCGGNKAFLDLCELDSESDLIGQTDYDIFPNDLAARYIKSDKETFEKMEYTSMESKLVNKHGKCSYLETTKTPLILDGKLVGIMGFVNDITEKTLLEQELRKNNELLTTMFNRSPMATFTKDRNLRFTKVNQRFLDYYGFKEEEVLGKTTSELGLNVDNRYIERAGRSVIDKGNELIDIESTTIRHGEHRLVKFRMVPLYDHDEITGLLGVVTDIDDLRRAEKQLEHSSTHDKLTGLFNRAFLMAELNRLNTKRNYPLSVVMIDVNGLKLFNDAYGHACGDVLLIRTAKTLRECLRKDDIVARLGGDEFTILLPKTSNEKALEIMETITDNMLSQTLHNIPLSISYGVATQQNTTRSISEIIAIADSKMYVQKESERAKYKHLAIEAIADGFFSKSSSLREHSLLVSNFAPLIGIQLEMDVNSCIQLGIMGYYHDIGFAPVNSEIFNKKSKLTREEMASIKKHTTNAYAILSSSPHHSAYALAISAHHERYDGKGYPDGLSGSSIPIHSRVISVADAIASMCSDRAYRSALTFEQIKSELINNSGTQFDPTIVDAVLSILPELLQIKQSGSFINYTKEFDDYS